MSRNRIIAAAILFTVALAILPSQSEAIKGRAISLKALQQKLKRGELPKGAQELCGITRVSGFVIDRLGKDLIIFGEVQDGAEPLHLDDFVVALRNAALRYARREGKILYYQPPGCSIDFDPKVLRRLREIARQMSLISDPQETKSLLQDWDRIGREPQAVRVMGVPFDSRFAKVMVDADYYMKRLVDGSAKPGIQGFQSLVDMAMDDLKGRLAAGKPGSLPQHSINRFWFCPGECTYSVDDGAIMLERCTVCLMTEEEFLSNSGRVAGTGRPSPLAKRWAETFTARYLEIAEARPIYAELEALFRMAAIAKIFSDSTPVSSAGINLDFLLSSYAVSKVPVSRKLPGITNIREFRQESETLDGRIISWLWLPSCGGVSMDFRPRRVAPSSRAGTGMGLSSEAASDKDAKSGGTGHKDATGEIQSGSTAASSAPTGVSNAQPNKVTVKTAGKRTDSGSAPESMRKIILHARTSPSALSWDFEIGE